MDKLIDISINAIIEESETFPSLGLVSKINSGSHTDMDINTFTKSINVFRPYLTDIYNSQSDIASFKDLQTIGIKYENKMFKLTNNINTHKGLIFSLGIFYFALISNASDEVVITNFIRNFCEPLKNDFLLNNSIGSKFHKTYKVDGARQTAVNGYSIVFESYRYYLNTIAPLNLIQEFKNFCLLLFISSKLDDTTLMNKIGYANFIKIQKLFKTKLNKIVNSNNPEKIIFDFNDYAIQNQISPGGSADIFVLVKILINTKFKIS